MAKWQETAISEVKRESNPFAQHSMSSPQIQFRMFPDGGFVLHKVTFPMFAGRFSAWFASDGALLDAEAISDRNRCTQVKRNGIKWGHLASIGKRYAAPQDAAAALNALDATRATPRTDLGAAAKFAAETAKRLQAFGEGLHGLASVQATAQGDAITLRVEYFDGDVTREGSGDADKMVGLCADMGLEAASESPADGGRGAFGPVEIYTLG